MAVIVISPADIERVVAANPPTVSHAMDYFKRRPMKNSAYIAVRDKIENIENRSRNFAMRPEQEEAVKKTKAATPRLLQFSEEFQLQVSSRLHTG